jgi:serine/threonine protein kinase
MTPGKQKKCPQCGVVLYGGVLSGLCPKCLLQGLRGSPAEGTETLWPPSVQSLAKAMRGHRVEPIEFIGSGGMGAVYKGLQCNLNRIVALKVMPPQAAEDGGHRFEREARSLAQLSHPNVVTVYDFKLAGNFPYFMMEFVDGRTLRQLLNESGPLIPSHAGELFLQLCDGLQHAHDRGVIHRDIKPENVLVDKKGLVKITDFGLAKLNGGADASSEWQTQDGQIVGTLGYMAPERFENQAVDHQADIYSAGVLLYELLTGERPRGLLPPPPSHKAKVDSSLDDVVLKALENDVALRYQDIRELKQAVEEAVEAVVINKKEPLQKMDTSDSLSQWAGLLAARWFDGGYIGTARA